MTQAEKRIYLDAMGFKVGARDPAGINTDFPGAFMVAEEYERCELPTRDGSNGPWCLIGDDLDALVDEAFAIWYDEAAEAENLRRALVIAAKL
jgi:hypothetical protein